MAKAGDIVFAKTFDVYTEETTVSPAIVTRVFTGSDGEWAKDKEILALTVFSPTGNIDSIQMDKGVTDDSGEWVAGGWADSEDGPSNAVAVSDPAPAPSAPVESATVTDAPVEQGSTGTVGSGESSAPVTAL
jgi:hypothetical protein